MHAHSDNTMIEQEGMSGMLSVVSIIIVKFNLSLYNNRVLF